MAWSTWASTKWPMRALAMTGIDTASMIWWTSSGSLMRATPPWARMSAGTRSRAMTATAPASSAILAWSAVTTSMMTPPLSISARPRLTRAVPVTWLLDSMLEHSSPVLEGPVQRLHFACSGAHFGFRGYTSPRPGFNGAGRLRAGEVAQGPAVQAADHAAGQADHGAVDRVDHHRRLALAEPGQGLLDADGGVHEVAALQPAADPAGGGDRPAQGGLDHRRPHRSGEDGADVDAPGGEGAGGLPGQRGQGGHVQGHCGLGLGRGGPDELAVGGDAGVVDMATSGRVRSATRASQ